MLNKIMMKSHSEQLSQVETSAVIHRKEKKRKMKKNSETQRSTKRKGVANSYRQCDGGYGPKFNLLPRKY